MRSWLQILESSCCSLSQRVVSIDYLSDRFIIAPYLLMPNVLPECSVFITKLLKFSKWIKKEAATEKTYFANLLLELLSKPQVDIHFRFKHLLVRICSMQTIDYLRRILHSSYLTLIFMITLKNLGAIQVYHCSYHPQYYYYYSSYNKSHFSNLANILSYHYLPFILISSCLKNHLFAIKYFSWGIMAYLKNPCCFLSHFHWIVSSSFLLRQVLHYYQLSYIVPG